MIQFSVKSCFDNQNHLKQKVLRYVNTYTKESYTNSAKKHCYDYFNLVLHTTLRKKLIPVLQHYENLYTKHTAVSVRLKTL